MNFKKLHIALLILFPLLFSCASQKKSRVNYENTLNSAKNYLKYYSDSNIENKAEYHFINGLTQQQKGNWAESIIDFNLALRTDSSAAILYSMSKSYYQMRRLNLSIETLLKSIEIQNDFVPSMDLLSKIYLNLNDVPNAIAIKEKIIKINPSYTRKLELAELYESHSTQKAIKLYRELYEQSKERFILKKLTDLYSSIKNNNEYTFLLEELYYTNKSNFEAGIKLLDHYNKNSEYAKALKLLNKIDSNIATDKLNIFYGTLGYAMLNDLNNSQDLVDDFTYRIDNRFYFNWQIQMLTAYLEATQNNFNETERRFLNAIKLTDTIPDIYLDAGIFLIQSRKFDMAANIFEIGQKKFPQMSEFHYFLGLSLEPSEPKKAKEAYYRALKLNSNYLECYIQLGVIFDRLGKKDSSDISYKKALKIEPSNPLANNNYAFSLSERGVELEKAEKMVQVALNKFPNNPNYLDTKAWILYKQKKYEKALDYIRDAIDIGGVSAEVYEHLGDILKALGRNEEAKEAYENALKIQPDRHSALENIKSLE